MFVKVVEDEGKARKRPPSVSLQFKRQVNELVTTLSQCKPHYVRCVKPNSTKSPQIAEPELMLHQVCVCVWNTQQKKRRKEHFATLLKKKKNTPHMFFNQYVSLYISYLLIFIEYMYNTTYVVGLERFNILVLPKL
jgi:hypothetical protein